VLAGAGRGVGLSAGGVGLGAGVGLGRGVALGVGGEGAAAGGVRAGSASGVRRRVGVRGSVRVRAAAARPLHGLARKGPPLLGARGRSAARAAGGPRAGVGTAAAPGGGG